MAGDRGLWKRVEVAEAGPALRPPSPGDKRFTTLGRRPASAHCLAFRAESSVQDAPGYAHREHDAANVNLSRTWLLAAMASRRSTNIPCRTLYPGPGPSSGGRMKRSGRRSPPHDQFHQSTVRVESHLASCELVSSSSRRCRRASALARWTKLPTCTVYSVVVLSRTQDSSRSTNESDCTGLLSGGLCEPFSMESRWRSQSGACHSRRRPSSVSLASCLATSRFACTQR